MIADSIKRAAEKLLPRCATLEAAEDALGHFTGKHNWPQDAVIWGLFDGYRGRPKADSGVPKSFAADYAEAFEIGSKLGRSEAS